MTHQTKKQSKFAASVQVTKAAIRIVINEKKMIGISALSALASLLIFGLAIWAAIVSWSYLAVDTESTFLPWPYYVGLAVTFMILTASATFFNAMLTHIAFGWFEGSRVSFKQALGAAAAKLPTLLGWAALTTTVGVVLNLIADRIPFAGRIFVWLAGASWGVATMFAIPVIMRGHETNPIKVVNKSASTFVGIWKESVFIGLTLGLISIAITIGVMVIVLGLFAVSVVVESGAIAAVALVVLMLSVIVLTIATSALQVVVMTAAYYYATTKQIPAGFDEELLRAMFKPKKKWLGV